MSSSTPIPDEVGFKFGDPSGLAPNSIQKIAQLDTYLVAYKDGEGKDQARVVFRIPGADATFMVNAKISGKNIVTQAHNWFHKAFVDKLRSEGFEESGNSEAAESL